MTAKKKARPRSATPQPLKGWRAEAYRRWRQGETVSVLASDYKTQTATIYEMIQRGKDFEDFERRERNRQVQGEPLIPLPPFEKKMEACRLFAAGQIDIGELAKRLRGQR